MSAQLPKAEKFDAKARLSLVLLVINKKKSVSRTCKRAGISRSFFYKLRKQYLQAGKSRKEKLKALEPKRKWVRRGRHLSETQIRQILKVILENPDYGIPRILRQTYARKHKKIVSHGGIQTFLLKLELNTKRKRRAFVEWARRLPKEQVIDLVLLALKRYRAEKPLSSEERLKAIRLVEDGAPVAYICRCFQIGRKNFYKWQQRYNQAVPGKEHQAVTDRRPVIERYWRQTTDEQVETILKIVVEHPEYSTHKIAEILPWIGNHGVQNVFRRRDLNTYEKRFAYAEIQTPAITPVVGLPARVKRIIGKIPVISAIPPPKAEAFRRAGPPFVFSFLSSVTLSTIFIYWLRMLSQAPTLGAKIGLFFASVALLIGGFFFAYSMKYYLTLALVLSFSRQPLEEGGGYVVGLNGRLNNNQKNNNHRGNWLQRIFGLRPYGPIGPEGLGDGDGERRELVQVGGLQPSLDHIKLKRYPFVSIHLPLYNEKKVAERILKACTVMDYPPSISSGQANYEVVVCDDSTDETINIVQRYAKRHNKKHPYGPRIKILHRPTRQGFKGGALGYALEHMNPKAEFVVVLDADFIPYPDTLELFVKYFKANNQGREDYTKSNIAVVGGYQWHVLNKSENWITRGVRTEYAGSYVIERPGREILGLIKQISGSVYMIRADLLKEIGWGTSITEDFQLTLKLYEQGYKVIYTPYIQAPAECVSTLGGLIRQRMRWAEGHSNNIKKMFLRLISSPKLTLPEKLEVLYLSPYYLQAAFFMVGTFCWLLAETVFRARLPFWTSLWGWSLVLTNFFSLPLMNAVGLFLEESEEKDYVGLLSFICLSYILVPFQAYASVKGFLEKEEGPWFRTPKTGKITDIFTRGRFYRWVSGILPGRSPVPAVATATLSLQELNPYLSLATANNQFNSFEIKSRKMRRVGRIFLVFVLSLSLLIHSMAFNAQPVEATWFDTDWTYRISITIQYEQVDATLTNFPVYVRLADLPSTFFSTSNTNCTDLRVIETNMVTQTAREVVACDLGGNTGELHFLADSVSSSSDTVFYIYYDNDLASEPARDATYGSENAWNSGYLGVYHLEEAVNTNPGGYNDSTSNLYHGTGVDMTATEVGGKIGKAQDLVPTADYIDLGASTRWSSMGDPGGQFTISAWVNIDVEDADRCLVCQAGSGNELIYWADSSSDDGYIFYLDGDYVPANNNPTGVFPGTWEYVIANYSDASGDAALYYNGARDGTRVTATFAQGAVNMLIGHCNGCSGTPRAWDGQMDEVRISDTADHGTVEWVDAEHTNQNTPTTFYNVGTQEEVPELVVLLIPVALAIPVIIKYFRRKYAKAEIVS